MSIFNRTIIYTKPVDTRFKLNKHNEEIDDFIIFQAINFLTKAVPSTITTLALNLVFSTGYSYCPSETVQITDRRSASLGFTFIHVF